MKFVVEVDLESVRHKDDIAQVLHLLAAKMQSGHFPSEGDQVRNLYGVVVGDARWQG